MSNLNRYTKNRKIAGWALLAISLGVGLITLYKGEFGDEADNLVVGALILRGYALYRDVFSHHFPFAYFWMAGVVAIFGKSLLAARLSILVFQVVALFAAMRISGRYLLVGLVALFWGVLRPYYFGHAVFYNSFAGAALLVVLVTTLTLL